MVFKKIWQCGHCGVVHKDETQAVECCQGMEETGYQCSHCEILYKEKVSGKCPSCGK